MHAYMSSWGVDNVSQLWSLYDVTDDAERRVGGRRMSMESRKEKGEIRRGRDGDALRYIITLAGSFPNKSLTVSLSSDRPPARAPRHVAALARRYTYASHRQKYICNWQRRLYDAFFARICLHGYVTEIWNGSEKSRCIRKQKGAGEG